MYLLIWSLAADAIDYNKVVYGLDDDATSYAFFSFTRKIGQTVQAVLVNASLMGISYTENVLGAQTVAPEVLERMYSDSCLIPAVLLLGVFVMLRFVYPLSKRKMAELRGMKASAAGSSEELG